MSNKYVTDMNGLTRALDEQKLMKEKAAKVQEELAASNATILAAVATTIVEAGNGLLTTLQGLPDAEAEAQRAYALPISTFKGLVQDVFTAASALDESKLAPLRKSVADIVTEAANYDPSRKLRESEE